MNYISLKMKIEGWKKMSANWEIRACIGWFNLLVQSFVISIKVKWLSKKHLYNTMKYENSEDIGINHSGNRTLIKILNTIF